jgi:hypothetical protein
MTESTVSDSPFRHLFLSNRSPSSDELPQIIQICTEHDQALDNLNRQIQDLEEKLRCLRVEQGRLLALKQSHKPLLSPIRHMPDDALQAIFMACLPKLPRKPAMHSSSEAPILLGRICQRWRKLLYATPQLWTRIHVDVPSQRDEGDRWLAELNGMKEWLNRSGSLPLHISLSANHRALYNHPDSGADDSDKAFINLTVFIDTLKNYSKRWKSFDLVMPLNKPVTLCTMGPEDIPQLESFFMRHDGNETTMQFPVFSFLRSARQLRVLSVSRYPSKEGISLVTFPLSQLTELHLHFTYWTIPEPRIDFPSIFRQCSNNLRICSIRHSRSYHLQTLPIPTTTHPILMSSLETLILTLSDDSHSVLQTDFNTILGMIEAPRLRNLQLLSNLDVDLLPAINDLISRSFCQLEELVICCSIDITSTNLTSLLIRSPNLIFLSIQGRCEGLDPNPGDVLLHAMTDRPDDDTAVICPQLRKLTIKNSFTSYTTTIREFVDSRIGNANSARELMPLETVLITSCWGNRWVLPRKLAGRAEWDDDVARWGEQSVKVRIDMPLPACSRKRSRDLSPYRRWGMPRKTVLEAYESDSEDSDTESVVSFM